MEANTEIIRCEIDGSWTAEDMAHSLLNFRDLYNLRLVLQVMYEESHDLEKMWFEFMHFPPFRRILKRRMFIPGMFPLFYPYPSTIPTDPEALSHLADFLYPGEHLEIRRIEYGSPGFKDLAGIGEIVGHVKDFVSHLIDLWIDRRKRKLENEESELHNQKLRIENAREFIRLAKECGYSESDMRRLTNWVDDRQEMLIILIEDKKLKSVRLLNEEKNSNNIE